MRPVRRGQQPATQANTKLEQLAQVMKQCQDYSDESDESPPQATQAQSKQLPTPDQPFDIIKEFERTQQEQPKALDLLLDHSLASFNISTQLIEIDSLPHPPPSTTCIFLFQNTLYYGLQSGEVQTQKQKYAGCKSKVTNIDATQHHLLVGYQQGTLALFNLQTQQLIKLITAHHSEVVAAKILFENESGSVSLISAEQQGPTYKIDVTAKGYIYAASQNVTLIYQKRLKQPHCIVHHAWNNKSLVAIGAYSETVICTMRPIQELFRIKRPSFAKEALPVLSLGYGLTPQQQEQSMIILAAAWDSVIQLVYITDRKEVIEDGYYCNDEQILYTQFVGDSILAIIDITHKLKLLHTRKFSFNQDHSRYADIDCKQLVAAKLFAGHGRQLVSTQRVKVVSVDEYLTRIEQGSWLSLLKVGVEIYSGRLTGFSDLPDPKQQRQQFLTPILKQLLTKVLTQHQEQIIIDKVYQAAIEYCLKLEQLWVFKMQLNQQVLVSQLLLFVQQGYFTQYILPDKVITQLIPNQSALLQLNLTQYGNREQLLAQLVQQKKWYAYIQVQLQSNNIKQLLITLSQSLIQDDSQYIYMGHKIMSLLYQCPTVLLDYQFTSKMIKFNSLLFFETISQINLTAEMMEVVQSASQECIELFYVFQLQRKYGDTMVALQYLIQHYPHRVILDCVTGLTSCQQSRILDLIQSQGSNELLLETAVVLFEMKGMFHDAFVCLVRTKSVKAFRYIQDHELECREYILQLAQIDIAQTVQLVSLKYPDFVVDIVTEDLITNRLLQHQFLKEYLQHNEHSGDTKYQDLLYLFIQRVLQYEPTQLEYYLLKPYFPHQRCIELCRHDLLATAACLLNLSLNKEAIEKYMQSYLITPQDQVIDKAIEACNSQETCVLVLEWLQRIHKPIQAVFLKGLSVRSVQDRLSLQEVLQVVKHKAGVVRSGSLNEAILDRVLDLDLMQLESESWDQMGRGGFVQLGTCFECQLKHIGSSIEELSIFGCGHIYHTACLQRQMCQQCYLQSTLMEEKMLVQAKREARPEASDVERQRLRTCEMFDLYLDHNYLRKSDFNY